MRASRGLKWENKMYKLKRSITDQARGQDIQSNLAISKSQGEMGKKSEIWGFRNNRGSVKFVTVNHIF